MKKKNIIAVLVAVVVIIAAVLLVSRYLKARTPILLQGTTECTTYKASSKIAGRIVDMKVEEGQRVKRGEMGRAGRKYSFTGQHHTIPGGKNKTALTRRAVTGGVRAYSAATAFCASLSSSF